MGSGKYEMADILRAIFAGLNFPDRQEVLYLNPASTQLPPVHANMMKYRMQFLLNEMTCILQIIFAFANQKSF